MNRIRLVACLSVVATLSVFVATNSAMAQSSTAQLSGRMTDASGAVLPGVTVTATHTTTGFTREAVTDSNGFYVMPNLPTGPYRFEAALAGFRSYVRTGIVLQVGAAPEINAVLQVGQVEQSVTVEAPTPLVDVQSAGISDVVDNERITQLPLQGREVRNLVLLAGAAVTTSGVHADGREGGGIAVAGGLAYGVTYVLDGASHNDPQDNLDFPLPFPDALQEFSVATGGLSAESGMHSGASVNAVTKSGTNTLHGNMFDFLRDHRFNATNPFAGKRPDGKRFSDGLVRNQFGGTLGGPLLRDKLFFFAGYQGTIIRQTPAANLAWVPTPAMVAGDFTAFTSPACNAGRQLTLRPPFVNNRIDPALFSRAALNLAAKLPQTGDPCGQITYSVPNDANEGQVVTREDYHLTQNQLLFGRYMATFRRRNPSLPKTGNILATSVYGQDHLYQTAMVGDTATFGPTMVNAFTFAFNRESRRSYQTPFFEARDLGSNVYSATPHAMFLTVTDPGFAIGGANGNNNGIFWDNMYQMSDTLTFVRGRHQLGLGANVAFWRVYTRSDTRAGGLFMFNGQTSGVPLGDLLIGRLQFLEIGAWGGVDITQLYFGNYAQDTWRATDRLTFNLGLRWEPFLGQQARDGAVYNFSLDNFRKGVRSTEFLNAPVGFLYPGDPGFPAGKSGLNKRWVNLSPRVGLAWDVLGNGRTAMRSSYSLEYDFPTGQYHFINSSAPPFRSRLRITDPSGGFDNPWAGIAGGDPNPIVTSPTTVFPQFGGFGATDPAIDSPRVQQWNLTFEQQFGADWGASVSYIGSYKDRLWGLVAINPGVYMGLDPCTIAGVSHPVCSTTTNLNQRRVLYQQNPAEAQFIGGVDRHSAVGKQTYHGLKLSGRRRAARGLSLNGNYTWSRCEGNTTPSGFSQLSAGFVKPDDPSYDSGHCDQDVTHLANVSIGAETPRFTTRALRVLASDWRVAGIITARSGTWLNVITGLDNAFTGITGQRPNLVNDQIYGHTLTNYLNAAAFGQPANGTYGDFPRNGVQGPIFRSVDMALSRLIPLGGTSNAEIRIEAFNVLNNFNWGNPVLTLSSPTFGRITTITGDPRIVQFGLKYGF